MKWINAGKKMPDNMQDYGNSFWISENTIVRNAETKGVVDIGSFCSYGKEWGLSKYEWLDETEYLLCPTCNKGGLYAHNGYIWCENKKCKAIFEQKD